MSFNEAEFKHWPVIAPTEVIQEQATYLLNITTGDTTHNFYIGKTLYTSGRYYVHCANPWIDISLPSDDFESTIVGAIMFAEGIQKVGSVTWGITEIARPVIERFSTPAGTVGSIANALTDEQKREFLKLLENM